MEPCPVTTVRAKCPQAPGAAEAAALSAWRGKEEKTTLQERAENMPLQTYPINTLDRNTRKGLPWACVGQVLSQAVAALHDSLQIAQQGSSVDQDKLWMAKVWFSHLPLCPLSAHRNVWPMSQPLVCSSLVSFVFWTEATGSYTEHLSGLKDAVKINVQIWEKTAISESPRELHLLFTGACTAFKLGSLSSLRQNCIIEEIILKENY